MHSNIVISEKVNATIEKVWEALTQKEQLKDWYYDIPDFSAEEHTEFSFYGGKEDKYHHHCEILEVNPNKKLKYSWTYPEISKDKTLVKWELDKDGEATRITLTHKGLENLEHLGDDFSKENFEKYWTEVLTQKLKNYLEK